MNEYILEGHTLVGQRLGAITAAWVYGNWIDMRYVDELMFVFMKEDGGAGDDPHIRFQARPKGGVAATQVRIAPHTLFKKEAAAADDLDGVGFEDIIGELSNANATLHEWTDATAAEKHLMVTASFFPESLVRAGAGLHEVRIGVKGTAADAAEFYCHTAFARLKDPEPVVGSVATQRVK